MPEVYWDLCRQDVMVMERIHGIQISEVARLRELGADIQKLAENGVTIFFTQVFRPQLLPRRHASRQHLRGRRATRRIRATRPVDFGIVGTLDPRDQLYLAGNFLAFFERDYRRVAVLHLESGWVPPGTRVDELESAVRTVCEPIFDKPLKDISFGLVLLHLFEIARRYQMQVQPQLILLQKTLLNIEGLGRQLYPELDLWKTAQPILRDWMRERAGPRAVFAKPARALARHRGGDQGAAGDRATRGPPRLRRRTGREDRIGDDRTASRRVAARSPPQRLDLRGRHRVPRRHRVAFARHAAGMARMDSRRGRRGLADQSTAPIAGLFSGLHHL